METKTLNDGMITVRIEGREPFDLDVYTAKLAIEEFEARHKVYETPGWTMTADAAIDLQESLRKIGVPFVSGSIALELWKQVNEVWEDVKKKWSFMPTSPTDTGAVPTDSAATS